jgi:hypothetical protein
MSGHRPFVPQQRNGSEFRIARAESDARGEEYQRAVSQAVQSVARHVSPASRMFGADPTVSMRVVSAVLDALGKTNQPGAPRNDLQVTLPSGHTVLVDLADVAAELAALTPKPTATPVTNRPSLADG